MIWLIGANGMLGRELAQQLTVHHISFAGTDIEVDITDINALTTVSQGKNFRWIINCSAYTAVDKAASDQEKALLINGHGVANIAQTAKNCGAKLIHFSTDYVFDGNKSGIYTETDEPNPQSVYGSTKLVGELAITKTWPEAFIIRISWLYGIYGPNFVKTMIRLFAEKPELNIIHDQIGSPTYAKTLATNIVKLITADRNEFGTYLYADDGYISWYDFAVKIQQLAVNFKLISRAIPIKPITTSQYPLPAKRPANSRFSKELIRSKLDFQVDNLEDNLTQFFNELTH